METWQLMAVLATNLGFPRIGPHRELKSSLEAYWAGKLSATTFRPAAAGIREHIWRSHVDLGIDHVPSGDFSLYDHVLDTAVLVGAIPERYQAMGPVDRLDRYFAMARGGTWREECHGAGNDEVVRHQLPLPGARTLGRATVYPLSSRRPWTSTSRRPPSGWRPGPYILGPVSFLLLSKHIGSGSNLDLLPALCDVYAELLEAIAEAGAAWVQIDEPVLALDLDPVQRRAFTRTYARARARHPAAAPPGGHLFRRSRGQPGRRRLHLPVEALHLDAVADPDQVDVAFEQAPDSLALSLGVVDGRNVWRTDLERVPSRLEDVRRSLGTDRLLVGPSCSLLHLPVDLDLEGSIDPELRTWLAFAVQRLAEIQPWPEG